MNKNKTAIFLIAFASVLIAFGDLRSLITPLGYWLLWLFWLSIAGIYLQLKQEIRQKKISLEIKILVIGFIVMLYGFIIASIANQDVHTLYQGFKLFVILIIGLCIIKISQSLTRNDIVIICSLVVGLSFFAFLFVKYFLPPLHLVLGDGREGTFLAAPGTLWKAGCFFSAFALAHYLSSKKPALGSLIIFSMGSFLVLEDGSRTGFLWLLISTSILITARIVSIRQKLTMTGIALIGFCITFVTYLVIFGPADNLASSAILGFERLTQGDGARLDMLITGIRQAEACLPFGCGFGATVSETYGMVVHNAYLGALGDVGILGLIGFVLISITPFFAFYLKSQRGREAGFGSVSYVPLAALIGSAGFIFNENLHSFRTEMSEWGLFFLMLSFFLVKANDNFQYISRKNLTVIQV